MTNSFHDVDLDLSKNALEDEEREEALEEGLDEDEMSAEFGEEEEEDAEGLSEEALSGLLGGDELSGGLDDEWGVDEYGDEY